MDAGRVDAIRALVPRVRDARRRFGPGPRRYHEHPRSRGTVQPADWGMDVSGASARAALSTDGGDSPERKGSRSPKCGERQRDLRSGDQHLELRRAHDPNHLLAQSAHAQRWAGDGSRTGCSRPDLHWRAVTVRPVPHRSPFTVRSASREDATADPAPFPTDLSAPEVSPRPQPLSIRPGEPRLRSRVALTASLHENAHAAIAAQTLEPAAVAGMHVLTGVQTSMRRPLRVKHCDRRG